MSLSMTFCSFLVLLVVLVSDRVVFCAGGINGDGNLTIKDLLILLSQFGCIETCNESDLDEEGSVSINDVLMLLSLL